MITTRSRRFSRGSSEGRKYSRSDSEKRKRFRLIPEWLEKNADLMNHPQPPNSIYDQDAFQELIENVADGNTVAVKLLADAGVNVNMQDSKGWTPLHHAVAKGKDEMAEVLISKGALRSRRNKDGLAPYELADHKNADTLDDDVFEVKATPAVRRGSKNKTRDNVSNRLMENSGALVPRKSSQRFDRARLGSDGLPISEQEIPHFGTINYFKRPLYDTDFSIPRSQSSQLPLRGHVFGAHREFDEELPGMRHKGQFTTRHMSYKSPDGMSFGKQSESFISYEMASHRKY